MGTADKDAVFEREEGERIICSIRYRGRYGEIGRHFSRLFAAPGGMVCRILEGGRAVVAVHRGSSAKLFGYCREKGHRLKVPARELYPKGPGMILPRNPKKFVTEIVAPIERD